MLGRKKYLGLAMGCLCSVLVSVPAFAAGSSAVAQIPAEQRFEAESSQETEDTFHYILKALEDSAPMPGGSEDGIYPFSMTGTQEILLNGITYTEPGIYQYEVFQLTDEKQDGYQYDNSYYSVDIVVRNTPSQGLAPEIIIKNEKGEKCDRLIFENSFKDQSVTGQPPEGNSQSGTNTVKTGDDTKVGKWLLIMAISGVCVIMIGLRSHLLMRIGKKKED